MKRVMLYRLDGQNDLDFIPSRNDMHKLLEDGKLDCVQVLDRVEGEKRIFSLMFIRATALIDPEQRNIRATEIYQRNIRDIYRDSPDPFGQAFRDFLANIPADMDRDTIVPQVILQGDWLKNPYISGPVIVFEGYTSDEALRAVEAANRVEAIRLKRMKDAPMEASHEG